jgi:Na+/H+ antiporter NhaD/arsenite permease-like protein
MCASGSLHRGVGNVVVAGTAEKAGHRITFVRFLGYGLPLMIESVAVATLYVWARYYL